MRTRHRRQSPSGSKSGESGRVAAADGELLPPATGSGHGGQADVGGLLALEHPLDARIRGGLVVLVLLLHDELLVEVGQRGGVRRSRGLGELGRPDAAEEREPAAGDAGGGAAAAGHAAQDLEEALVGERVERRQRQLLPLLLGGPRALGRRRRGDRGRRHQGALPLLLHGAAAEEPGHLRRRRDEQGWVFLFSLIGITPLAERLGYATEQLACYTGPTVGGLLNATFGNATEMIISIYALKNGMIRVVQQSLLGSILSNMLLVLGCAFFAGGLVHSDRDQVFNKASAVVNSGLLLMAVLGLMFPAVLHFTHSEAQYGKSEVALSRFSSCIMLVAYASYLFFQLKSHRSMYCPIGDEEEAIEDEEDEKEITQWEAICWLFILTIWISVLSGYLVDAIQGASDSLNLPVAFISVILLPIVGNAAEHASAIMFAMKNKLDITLGVAIGSSTQISMFVIPFCVVIGWIMGQEMDLNFQLFETATLFITVLVVAFMLQEGTSNYFKGLMLILCYLIVGASFFVHVDPDANEN